MTDGEKLDLILSKMDHLETKMDHLETKMDHLETKVDQLETKAEHFETDLQEVKKRVINTDLLIENEIRVNIQRVAEGYLDLSRNLHDALKIGSEKEMLAIRVGVLESEIRRIKMHLDIA